MDKKYIECGKFFISATIRCSTENGNHGVYFDDFRDYPISYGRSPTCAERCHDNLIDYINDHGNEEMYRSKYLEDL